MSVGCIVYMTTECFIPLELPAKSWLDVALRDAFEGCPSPSPRVAVTAMIHGRCGTPCSCPVGPRNSLGLYRHRYAFWAPFLGHEGPLNRHSCRTNGDAGSVGQRVRSGTRQSSDKRITSVQNSGEFRYPW